jgi:hypothetical protein
MRRTADRVRVLRGFPPNAINVNLVLRESAVLPPPDSSSPLRH